MVAVVELVATAAAAMEVTIVDLLAASDAL